jgi:hypothetical protein
MEALESIYSMDTQYSVLVNNFIFFLFENKYDFTVLVPDFIEDWDSLLHGSLRLLSQDLVSMAHAGRPSHVTWRPGIPCFMHDSMLYAGSLGTISLLDNDKMFIQ